MNGKKLFTAALFLLAIFAMAAPALAGPQEAPIPGQGPEIPIGSLFGLTPDGIAAAIAVAAGWIVKAIVQWLKKQLKISGGWKAWAVTGAMSIGATAYTLLAVTHNFTLLAFIGYSAFLFGWASGLYTITPTPKKT